MRFQLFGSGRRATAAATSAGPRMSHRQALKALLTGAGVLGLAKVAGFGSTEAAYVTGPPDVVNTSLEVQGDLKVTSSGKVGVGTIAPATAVHVAGSTPALTVGPYAVSNRPGDIQATGAWAALWFAKRSLGSWPVSPVAGDAFGWYCPDGTARLWTPYTGDVLAVTAGGNVGIGTSAPTAKLHVNGDLRATGPIRINGTTAIDAQGVAVQAYYAP